jgi:predicted DNA-binding protein YlxM (UPF0122 family)
MERLVRTGMLYDYYGGLLTERQRQVMELFTQENWSLGEIAAETGVSRQAVHDLLQRSERLMEEYEAKLALVEQFLQRQETVKTALQKMQIVLESLPVSNPNHQMLFQAIQELNQWVESES